MSPRNNYYNISSKIITLYDLKNYLKSSMYVRNFKITCDLPIIYIEVSFTTSFYSFNELKEDLINLLPSNINYYHIFIKPLCDIQTRIKFVKDLIKSYK